jgi:hypothetical protein
MKAIDYIRKGWTQQVYARDVNGSCARDNSSAVAWCSLAAILNVYDENSETLSNALMKLRIIIGHWDIVRWNDAPERTHQEVIDAFERAGI